MYLTLFSSLFSTPVGHVPVSFPPTTAYYQGPPYMMGGPGGGPYAPPPMSYTPMPYVTGNYGGVEGNGGLGVFRSMGGGVRTTGVGGSEKSVASGNSNASSNSVDSVCVANRKDADEAEGGRRIARRKSRD